MILRALALTLVLASAPALAGGQEAGTAAPAAVRPALGATVADSALDAQTRVIASQLRCPVCQGQSLQDSGSELAREMRSLITDQLRAGKSPDEVRQYFVSKYGEWILLQPEAHGFNLAVYLLPLLALLGGGVFLLVAARRWIGGSRAEAEEPIDAVPADHS